MRNLALTLMIVSGAAVLRADDGSGKVFGLSAGMGISVVSATDIVDYINSVSSSPNRLDDFASAAEFFATAELRVTDSWGAKFEYAYLIKSYNVVDPIGQSYDYSYGIHMPMLMAQYLDIHPMHAFKFGGGLGYHVALFSETVQGRQARTWKSSGIGLKLEIEANTALGEQLYAFIAGDVRVDIMSTLKEDNGSPLPIRGTSSKNASMSFFGLGLKLGMMYYF